MKNTRADKAPQVCSASAAPPGVVARAEITPAAAGVEEAADISGAEAVAADAVARPTERAVAGEAADRRTQSLTQQTCACGRAGKVRDAAS
jgi:hypothetical protein